MVRALRPGVTERQLVGAYVAAVARLGMTCPPSEGVAWVTSGAGAGARPRRVATDRPLAEGDVVALHPGAFYAGYEASIGRTRRVGGAVDGPLADSVLANRALLDAVVGACRPGATGSDLLDIWRANGGGELTEPLAWGLGLGVEPPVIGSSVGGDAVIRAGAVLAVQAWTVQPGSWAILEQDVVAVGPEGPSVVTRTRSGW